MASKLYCELSKICSASLMRRHNQKTSLAKYSIEFNDLTVQTRPHQIPFLRLLDRPYTLLYMSRSVGRLSSPSPHKTMNRKKLSEQNIPQCFVLYHSTLTRASFYYISSSSQSLTQKKSQKSFNYFYSTFQTLRLINAS